MRAFRILPRTCVGIQVSMSQACEFSHACIFFFLILAGKSYVLLVSEATLEGVCLYASPKSSKKTTVLCGAATQTQ